MLSTTQIIILVALTLFSFTLGPYFIILREKKLNQNRIQKKSPKGNIIYYLFISVFSISFLAFTMYVNNISEVKYESKPVPEPQIETKAEYYYKKGDRYGTKYTLTEKDKPFLNSQGKWMLNNVGEIEEPVIEKTYKFFGFNGFDQCQYKDKVPQDLAPFIREPFNNWFYTNKMPPYKGLGGSEVDYFMPSQFFIDVLSTEDSKFNNSFVNIEHTIEMEYKGPKYLLEEDKDFYVNEVKCPLQQNKRWEEGRNATYYLHFNPKKQYITLYTEKMNTKEK